MMDTFKKTFLAFAWGSFALNLSATDWYLINKENDGSHVSWYNAGRWRVRGSNPVINGESGKELSSEDTYAVIWEYYVRAKSRSGQNYGEFVGKRLVIEDGWLLHETAGTATDPKRTYFRNDGLFLQKGGWYYNGGFADRTITVEGAVTVESPAEKPFTLAAMYDNNSFVLNGPLKSAENAVFQIGVGTDYNKNELAKGNFSVTLAGDCTNYFGGIAVTSVYDNASSSYGCKLTLDTSVFSGSLSFAPGTVFAVSDSLQKKTIGSLSLNGRALLAMSNRFPLAVTNSFSIIDGPLPLEVSVSEERVPTDSAETNRVAILEYPATSGIGLDDFRPYAAGNDMIMASFAGLEISEADGKCTVSAVLAPVVKQTVRDEANNNYQGVEASSLFEQVPAHWSDGFNVHEGANYLVSKIDGGNTVLLTPGKQKESYVFPGESLTIGAGCQIRHFNDSLYVKKMNFRSGSYMFVGNSAGGVVTGDVVNVESGEVKFSAYTGCKVRIDSEIRGRANIWFGQIGGESNPQAFNEFTRLNTNFFGSIYVRQVIPPDLERKFQTLYVSDERNLGGRLGTFNYTALLLENMSRLRTRKSFELTENMNRGVYVNGVGRFYADEGMKMGMNAVLTMNGLLRKEGSGVLSMGGRVKFFSSAKVPGDEPRANSNLFEVVEGAVEVTKAHSIDGLETTFRSGTKLVLCANRDDGELTDLGIVNAKIDVPFVLDETLAGRLPIAIKFADGYAPVTGEEIGLLTVSSAAADAVQAMLPKMFWTSEKGVAAEVFRRDSNADTTVTFAVRLRRYGFRFVVR